MGCLEPKLGRLIFEVDGLQDADLRIKVNDHRENCPHCRAQWDMYRNIVKGTGSQNLLHPNSEQLLSYARGSHESELSAEENSYIDRHQKECESCSELVKSVREANLLLAEDGYEDIPLFGNLTNEFEANFTTRLMNVVSNMPHPDPNKEGLKEKDVLSWHENSLASIKEWLFRWKVIVSGVAPTIAVIVLLLYIYKPLPSVEDQVVKTNSDRNSFPDINANINHENNGSQPAPTPLEELAQANQKTNFPSIKNDKDNKDSHRSEEQRPTSFTLNDAGGLMAIDTQGSSSALSKYTPSVRKEVSQVLNNGISEFPALSEIKYKEIILMGAGSNPKPFSLQPNGKVLRTPHPEFSWETYEGALSYEVRIFDVYDKYRPVASIKSLKTTSWVPTIDLSSGRVYSWELWVNLTNGESKKLPEKEEVRFKILEKPTEEYLRQAETIIPRSHLVLGSLFARAGLFDDAEREFQELLRLNPNSKKAAYLLKSVQSRIGENAHRTVK